MDETQKHANLSKIQKNYILHDSIYEISRKGNFWRLVAENWLPAAEGGDKNELQMGMSVLFEVLEMF